MILLYFLYGPTKAHLQQLELSVLSWKKNSKHDVKFLVITDAASEFFQDLGVSIQVETVKSETFREWMGPTKFFWRIKICSILHAMYLHPDSDIFYSDTDIVCKSDPIQSHWEAGTSYMDQCERKFSEKLEVKENKN